MSQNRRKKYIVQTFQSQRDIFKVYPEVIPFTMIWNWGKTATEIKDMLEMNFVFTVSSKTYGFDLFDFYTIKYLKD